MVDTCSDHDYVGNIRWFNCVCGIIACYLLPLALATSPLQLQISLMESFMMLHISNPNPNIK